jgi:hypothetical protein
MPTHARYSTNRHRRSTVRKVLRIGYDLYEIGTEMVRKWYEAIGTNLVRIWYGLCMLVSVGKMVRKALGYDLYENGTKMVRKWYENGTKQLVRIWYEIVMDRCMLVSVEKMVRKGYENFFDPRDMGTKKVRKGTNTCRVRIGYEKKNGKSQIGTERVRKRYEKGTKNNT